MGQAQTSEGPMKTVLIYVDTNYEVGHPDHLRVFADSDAADEWFKAHDPEGVAFAYEIEGSPAFARSKTMTDEQLAAMHRLLAEYHRKLAREAMLDVVQQYHADLAQRFADEATQIPRRTAILERLHEREQQKP